MLCYSFRCSAINPFRKIHNNHIRNFAKKTSFNTVINGNQKTNNKGNQKTNNIPKYNPRTPNQESYVNYLNDNTIPIVFGVGPAGCGKTLFACVAAINELRHGSINKIILTRPIVPVEEEELGFLPGDLINKMDPWTRPLFDIFLEYYNQKEIDDMLKDGVIEISPLAYMRGRTFKNAFIIADEMQNSTPNQMLMLTTRIGNQSKMVITGDLKQSDRLVSNGLSDVMSKIKNYFDKNIEIKIIEMSYDDIERSPIVAKILNIYNYKPISNIVDTEVIDTDVVHPTKATIKQVIDFYNDKDDIESSPCSSNTPNTYNIPTAL